MCIDVYCSMCVGGRLFLWAEGAAKAAGAGGEGRGNFPARWGALNRNSSESTKVEMAEKIHAMIFLVFVGTKYKVPNVKSIMTGWKIRWVFIDSSFHVILFMVEKSQTTTWYGAETL